MRKLLHSTVLFIYVGSILLCAMGSMNMVGSSVNADEPTVSLAQEWMRFHRRKIFKTQADYKRWVYNCSLYHAKIRRELSCVNCPQVDSHIQQSQKVQEHILSLQKDIEKHAVKPERLWNHKKNLTLDSKVFLRHSRDYYITCGLYAWQLHLRSGDEDWNRVFKHCFSRAAYFDDITVKWGFQMYRGQDSVYLVCPKGWTPATRAMWNHVKTNN